MIERPLWADLRSIEDELGAASRGTEELRPTDLEGCCFFVKMLHSSRVLSAMLLNGVRGMSALPDVIVIARLSSKTS